MQSIDNSFDNDIRQPVSIEVKMKHTKTWGAFLTALLAAVVFSGTSFADFREDTQQIVNNFNNLNSGQDLNGIYFKYPDNDGSSTVPPVTKLTIPTNYDSVNLDAYASGRGSTAGRYFNTFCVEPSNEYGLRDNNKLSGKIGMVLVGTLSYNKVNDDQYFSATSENKKLSVGAALLYTMYATGQISPADELLFQRTILGLMGVTKPGTNYASQYVNGKWGTNEFLKAILAVSGENSAYLLSAYDPGIRYDYIGDYSVFVMNVTTQGGKDSQDFLIIQKHENSDVPEPATLLLWTLGGLGVAGTSWARKRRLAKAA